MAWGSEAQQLVFQLYALGQAEREIVKAVCDRHKVDDKTVRRCVAALDLLQAQATSAPQETISKLQERFTFLNGGDHYLREAKRTWDAWLAPKVGNPELESHRRELFYLGRRLRSRLDLPLPHRTESIARGGQLLMWSGKPTSLSAQAPQDDGEKSVDEEWAFERYDARTHPLYPSIHQHLKDHPCWATLKQVEEGFRKYREACRAAYDKLTGEVQRRLPDLTEVDADSMARSLVADAYPGVASELGGLAFSYEPQATQDGGQVRWHLQLGAWKVGDAKEPQELRPIAVVHQELAQVLPSMAELKALGEASLTVRLAIQQLRQALSPDALLRKLIASGRCDLCPGAH